MRVCVSQLSKVADNAAQVRVQKVVRMREKVETSVVRVRVRVRVMSCVLVVMLLGVVTLKAVEMVPHTLRRVRVCLLCSVIWPC